MPSLRRLVVLAAVSSSLTAAVATAQPYRPLIPLGEPQLQQDGARGGEWQLRTTLEAEGTALATTASVAGRVSLEGRRWGVMVDGRGLPGLSDDPADTLRLGGARLTYALLSEGRGRLRMEVGAAVAALPSATLVAPQVGASTQIELLGPVGLDAAIRWTPWPFKSLDWNAGVGLSGWGAAVVFGWREIRFDDLGNGGTDRLAKIYAGPSLTASLTF